MIQVIIAAAMLFGWTLYTSIKSRQIPYCLSETAYTAPKWQFAVMLLLQMALLFPVMVEKTGDNLQWIVFLLCIAIAGIAVSPFKDELLKYSIHYACACIVMLAVLALCIMRGWGACIFGYFALMAATCSIRCIRYYWLLILEVSLFLMSYIYCL